MYKTLKLNKVVTIVRYGFVSTIIGQCCKQLAGHP